MKAKIFIISLVLVLMASFSFADGTVTSQRVQVGKEAVLIVFTCVGDSGDGSIPDTDFDANDMKFLRNGDYYLVDVIAFPTPSGTAPDAADVTLKIKNYPTATYGTTIAPAVPRDILVGAGTNLIHATDEQSIGASMPLYERVLGSLTFGVANQGTNDAEYTVIFKFEK